MLQAAKEFKIGRPQIVAGLMLLAFFAQTLWVAASRQLSDLEIQYIVSGESREMGQTLRANSPLTGWVAAVPNRVVAGVRAIAPATVGRVLAIPRAWLFRLPFVIFGLWLGGALWWVARRLFDDAGGYVALALYCSSRAMVMVSATVGPEIVLAWSFFGLIYTAIGVAHTLYAPPRKWIPRVIILGLSIGFALSTAWWSIVIVALAVVFMLYLAPGRRRSVLIVLLGASVVAAAVMGYLAWWAGPGVTRSHAWIQPHVTRELAANIWYVMIDDDRHIPILTGFFIAALAIYVTWRRARYFGNTAPLITGLVAVLLFTLVPAIHIWNATLGLSFAFVFIGGVAADLLETPGRKAAVAILLAGILPRAVLAIRALSQWIHQNTV